VVYTDASYDATRQGLGVIVVDTLTDKRYICGGQVPLDLLAWIMSHRSDLKTKINQGELLAVVAVVMTFPDILLERDVVFWVDNTTALSACVDGYSNFPDLATLSNALHLLLAGLRTRSYFLHVPGKVIAPTSPVEYRLWTLQGSKYCTLSCSLRCPQTNWLLTV